MLVESGLERFRTFHYPEPESLNRKMEKLYQYLWKSRMFGMKVHEADGAVVEVLDPGRLNLDAGPDFFNSKIKVDGTEWVGNIEIHVKASDWFRHHHDADPAYDSIILHVVGISDRRIKRRDGSLIPQVEITVPQEFILTFDNLANGGADLRCAASLPSQSKITVTDWLEALAIERLQVKAKRVADTMTACSHDWQQACFVTLARALGFGLNGDPFELLARSIPLNILHHHSDNPFQIQAILFGQAAMLDPSNHIFDEYYQGLCREYYFLARKYGLKPMRPGLWKYSKTRPQNFPHRRIAFLAKACEDGFSLFSKILECHSDQDALRRLFNWKLDGYWHDHSSFDLETKNASDSLSNASVTLLLINAVVPLIYAYASHCGDYDMAESALNILEGLPPESNSILRVWESVGLKADSALRSQALIHLKKEYCDARKCLYCRFGHQSLKKVSGMNTSLSSATFPH